jgi:hypothetical protein
LKPSDSSAKGFSKNLTILFMQRGPTKARPAEMKPVMNVIKIIGFTEYIRSLIRPNFKMGKKIKFRI